MFLWVLDYFFTQLQQSLVITNHFWTFLSFDYFPCDHNEIKICALPKKKKRKYIKIICQNSEFVREIFPSFYFYEFSKFLLWVGISFIVGKRRLIPPQTKESCCFFFLYRGILSFKTFKCYFKKMVFLILSFPCSWWQFTICVYRCGWEPHRNNGSFHTLQQCHLNIF